MDLEKRIKEYSKGEFRSIASPFKENDKGKYVLSGLISPGLEQKIGILVQIRAGKGAFGTDIVLIRESNGNLSSHHNQCFWIIPDEYSQELDELFKNVYRDDADLNEYSIEGKENVLGFLT